MKKKTGIFVQHFRQYQTWIRTIPMCNLYLNIKYILGAFVQYSWYWNLWFFFERIYILCRVTAGGVFLSGSFIVTKIKMHSCYQSSDRFITAVSTFADNCGILLRNRKQNPTIITILHATKRSVGYF